MKITEFFSYCIKCGMEADPRGRDAVKRSLAFEKEKFDKMPAEEKKFYDKERLVNPYADSRILHNPLRGAGGVKKILCGIDIDAGEILLADNLKRNGRGVDLVMAHHPQGYSYSNFFDVMDMQSEIQSNWGVPINIAEDLLVSRRRDVEMSVMPRNHTKTVDAAKIIGIPFLNVHTPADNHVASFLGKIFAASKNLRLKDVIDRLVKIEEYCWARKNFLPGPKIIVGKPESSAGKIVIDMTGGTEGPVDMISKMAEAGVGTIVGMHFSEKHIKKARRSHVNIIIAGHISSDNLGLNLLFDKIEKKFGGLQIIECSGFHRVSRK